MSTLKKIGRFTSPAWHWSLIVPESRYIPKRLRKITDRSTRKLFNWKVSIPQGFSLSQKYSAMDCTQSECARQKRRLSELEPIKARSPAVWCSLAYRFPSPYAVRVNINKRGVLRCWLLLTDGAEPLGYAQRTFDFSAKLVKHDYLTFVQSARGNGHGAQILANALCTYAWMGISTIMMTAGLSAGSAVWPRLGFSPVNEDEWTRLRSKIRLNIEKLSPLVHEKYSDAYGRNLTLAIGAVVDDNSPEAIFDLVDLDPNNRAGKAAHLPHGIAGILLSGGHWMGRLEIDGIGGRRLRTYLKEHKVSFPNEPA